MLTHSAFSGIGGARSASEPNDLSSELRERAVAVALDPPFVVSRPNTHVRCGRNSNLNLTGNIKKTTAAQEEEHQAGPTKGSGSSIVTVKWEPWRKPHTARLPYSELVAPSRTSPSGMPPDLDSIQISLGEIASLKGGITPLRPIEIVVTMSVGLVPHLNGSS